VYFDCQVITRFIASSCPVIYWFVAMVTLPRLQSSDHSVTTLWEVSRDELCATKHMQYLNFLTCCNTWRSRAIFAYFVLYMFVGVAAFVNFLPWTWIVKSCDAFDFQKSATRIWLRFFCDISVFKNLL